MGEFRKEKIENKYPRCHACGTGGVLSLFQKKSMVFQLLEVKHRSPPA
jgi:hypothetical protein